MPRTIACERWKSDLPKAQLRQRLFDQVMAKFLEMKDGGFEEGEMYGHVKMKIRWPVGARFPGNNTPGNVKVMYNRFELIAHPKRTTRSIVKDIMDLIPHGHPLDMKLTFKYGLP